MINRSTALCPLDRVQKVSGSRLTYQMVLGKPSVITYFFAEQTLRRMQRQLGLAGPLARLYCVG